MVDIDKSEIIDRFSVWDYLVFVIMLLLSAVIGVFFAINDRKKKDTKEFLLAGKSMGSLPVALSLIASFMSAIALLGTPSEVYQNGLIYYLIGVAYILVTFSAAFLYLPVFWNLQVISAYEYLEKRFNKSVRMMGSIIFMIQMLMYMAIVVYAPALALSQVTGINVYVSVSSISFVCIFYTTLGGMKAVLWTDALQVTIMYGSLIFVIVKGVMDEGGLGRIWEVSTQGNRTLLVDWDFDPRTRHTAFSLIFGGYFTWITIYGVNQAQVQRYLCVKSKRMAIKALMINLVGLLILLFLICLGGLVLYTKYVDCDPVSSGLVNKYDQIFPLFVMETLGHLKGLPGLFVAGIFAGALSTVSSGINSLAATTLEDFIKAIWPNITEHKANILSRVLSLLYGVITFGLVFVAEQLGDVLSAALGIFGIVGGPLLGVFTLGMFFPWANSKGALVGTISALVLTLWIGIGAQLAIHGDKLALDKLPLNTCDLVLINGTYTPENSQVIIIPPMEESGDLVLEFYKLSYMLYSALGCLTTIFIGMIVSALTGLQNLKQLNPNLLSPAVSWFKCLIPGYHLIGIDIEEQNEVFGMVKKKSQGQLNPTFNGRLQYEMNFKDDPNVERTKL